MLLAGDQQRSSCAEHYRRIKIIRSRSVSPGQPQRIRSRVHDAQSPANERTSTVSPPVYPATTDIDPLSSIETTDWPAAKTADTCKLSAALWSASGLNQKFVY